MSERDLDMVTAALTALVEHGIPADVQELLVLGNPSRGIAPGALSMVVRAVLIAEAGGLGPRHAAGTADQVGVPRVEE